MAISIIKRPESFSPSGNPIIFQVSTNNNNIVYFDGRLIEDDSTTIINQVQIYPTPALPTGSYIDLQRLLDDIVKWEMNNDANTFIAQLTKPVKAYRLRLTEMNYNSGTGTVVSGATYDDMGDVNYVYYAGLGRGTFNGYSKNDYVVNTTKVASFLTSKPDHVKVNELTAEHLYFLQNGSVNNLQGRVRFYNGATIVTTVAVDTPYPATTRMYRMNISPKALTLAHGIDFTSITHYVVDVWDGATTRVAARTYHYSPSECHLEYINVLWSNSFGGFDSYQFVAPNESVNVTRNMLKRNIYGVNAAGYYSDINQDIFNPSDIIISNKMKTEVKVTSKELSDKEGKWLQELLKSKQVFIELTDTKLVPVLLNQSSYDIPRLRYKKGQLNTVSFEFTLADGMEADCSYIFTSDTAALIPRPPVPTPTPTPTPEASGIPLPIESAQPTPTPSPSFATPTPTIQVATLPLFINKSEIGDMVTVSVNGVAYFSPMGSGGNTFQNVFTVNQPAEIFVNIEPDGRAGATLGIVDGNSILVANCSNCLAVADSKVNPTTNGVTINTSL